MEDETVPVHGLGEGSLTAACSTEAQRLLRTWAGLKDTKETFAIVKQICLIIF